MNILIEPCRALCRVLSCDFFYELLFESIMYGGPCFNQSSTAELFKGTHPSVSPIDVSSPERL